jgi:two-component system, sensor kinase
MSPDLFYERQRIDTVRQLRVGWGASTELGVGTETREHVVIRRLDLSITRLWSMDWLIHELEVIASSNLSHQVTTRIASTSADEAVLVRPYVRGRDILEWSGLQPRQSIDRQLQLMCDLFFAVVELHHLGIAHGGLKPANVIVADDSAHLVLLDAGVTRTQLAAAMHTPDSADSRFTPREPAGLPHRTIGFAADIFAAGRVLLEIIAERNRTTSSLMRSGAADWHTTSQRLAHTLDMVGVPPVLRPIFLKLLDPVPEQRYENAEDVLAALEAVVATRTDGAPRVATHSDEAFPYVEPPLVGRHAELDMLKSCIDMNATNDAGRAGSVMCISGESGIGKSRLLDAVTKYAEQAGLAVLRGGATDYAAQQPLGLFAEPFRGIVTHLRENPTEADRVGREMGELLGPAIELVPGLIGIYSGGPATGFAGSGLGDRSVATASTAIARLLEAVFTASRPGLLLVDDCQWADDLSWQVLAKVTSKKLSESTAPLHFSLICSCRPEAIAQMRSWSIDGLAFLELLPLSSSETEEIVRSFGEHLPDKIGPYVIKYSEGNPLDALSVLRALIDSSALTRTGDQWTVDEEGMRSLPLLSQSRPSDASGVDGEARTDIFVATRLDLLSHNTRQAIHQAAIFGRQFSAALLCRALEMNAVKTEYLLREGVERGILRRVAGADEEGFEFTHDRLREAVLRSLSQEQRRDLHRRAADVLRGPCAERSDYEIAYHLHHCGQVTSAVPYALRAGEAGLRQHALDVAESNFEIAEAGLQSLRSVDDHDKLRIYEGLGTVQMLLGSYDLAAEKLSSAYDVAQSLPGLESARVATLLSELAFKTGRFEDAAAWTRQGMHDLGLRTPRWCCTAVLSSLVELGILLLGWVARRGRPATLHAGSERARLAARIYHRLGYEWWFVKSPTWIRWAMLRGLRFARAGGNTRERAYAFGMVGVAIGGTVPFLGPVTDRFTMRSLRMCQAADDEWGVAHAQHFRGFMLQAAARYDEAIEAFDAAIAAFDTLGDRWEQLSATWQKALCLMRRGKLHEAGVIARETYWEAKRIGDRIGAGMALAVWVRCLPGDVAPETIVREIRQTNSDDHHTIAMLQAARGWRLLHSNHYEHAAHAFTKAEESIRTAGIKNHFLAFVIGSHLHVLRLRHEATPAWWAGTRRNRAKDARRQLARALRWAVIFPSERAAVLREWAMMSISRGHTWRGQLILCMAARSASEASADGDLAACSSVADLAWIKSRRGQLGRLPAVSEPCRLLGIRVDRGIVEAVSPRAMPTGGDSSHHRALLDAVNSIVASDDAEDVLAKLRDATIATTTARRVEISRLPGHVDRLSLARTSSAPPPGPPPEDPLSGAESRGMKRTERVVKQVIAGGHHASSIIAAFPLGDAAHHEPTLEVLAALASAVIDRGKLRRESIERIVEVQEAERGRIARDLHDEFGHLFAAIMDRLSALNTVEDASIRSIELDMRKMVRQGISSARAVAWSLRPSGLEDLGLLGCIEQFVEDCLHSFPVSIELSAPQRLCPISLAAETAIFRIVQEALTNVGRHSHATHASVLLVSSGESLRVVIEDDGIGFDMGLAGQRRSLGLIGMRERTQLIGGRLQIDSRPSHGTTVVVEVPTTR